MSNHLPKDCYGRQMKDRTGQVWRMGDGSVYLITACGSGPHDDFTSDQVWHHPAICLDPGEDGPDKKNEVTILEEDTSESFEKDDTSKRLKKKEKKKSTS